MSSYYVFTALLSSLVVIAYLYVKNAYSYWKRKGLPFLQPSFPFGNFREIFLQKSSFDATLEKIYKNSTEPVVGVYSTVKPMLLIRDPKISFTHRGMVCNEKVDPMADNIVLQQGDKWKNARTKFSPAFTSGRMRGMFDTVYNCTYSLNKHLGKFADKDQTVEVRDLLARFATNGIASIAFGLEIDCINNPDCDFRNYGKKIFEPTIINATRLTLSMFTPKLAYMLGVRFADKSVSDFMIKTVKENLAFREQNNYTRRDFFQLLMQWRNTGKIQDDNDWSAVSKSADKSLTIEEMSAQAFLFFAGGYETSSTTMSFCLYEMARNPEVQQTIYEEIVSTLERFDDQLNYESLSEMKYTENSILETLRMHPPFGVLGRECTKDYKLPGTDVIIEKGTALLFSVNGPQRDSQYYDEPNEYKPERFDESQKGKNSTEMPFLAFGDGPRNCLGLRLAKMQTKLAVVTVLQKYRLELADEHKNTELQFSPKSLTKEPLNGINLKIFSR